MAPYMDSATTFSGRAHRVIASYPDIVSDYLGMAQIVLSFIVFILAVVGLLIKAYTAAGVTGVLLFLALLTCGTFGILAGVKKEVWAITGYLVLSVMSIVMSVVVLGCAVVGVSVEYELDSTVSVGVREGIDIALIVLAIVVAASAILSLILTVNPVCSDTCTCIQGAKYVEEPAIQFTNPVHSDAAQTVENSGYDQPHSAPVPAGARSPVDSGREHIPPPQPNIAIVSSTDSRPYFNNPLSPPQSHSSA